MWFPHGICLKCVVYFFKIKKWIDFIWISYFNFVEACLLMLLWYQIEYIKSVLKVNIKISILCDWFLEWKKCILVYQQGMHKLFIVDIPKLTDDEWQHPIFSYLVTVLGICYLLLIELTDILVTINVLLQLWSNFTNYWQKIQKFHENMIISQLLILQFTIYFLVTTEIVSYSKFIL